MKADKAEMHGASFLSWESIFEACTTFMWTARPTQIVWQFATPLLKKKSDSARCQDLSRATGDGRDPLILALHLPAVHPQVFQLLRGNGVVHGCSGCPEKEPESRPAP